MEYRKEGNDAVGEASMTNLLTPADAYRQLRAIVDDLVKQGRMAYFAELRLKRLLEEIDRKLGE